MSGEREHSSMTTRLDEKCLLTVSC